MAVKDIPAFKQVLSGGEEGPHHRFLASCQCGGQTVLAKEKENSTAEQVEVEVARYTRVSWPYRVCFYAINAFWIEVFWTALYEVVLSGDLKLVGYSSVWSLLIYGLGFLGIEVLYFYLLARNVNLLVRGLVYMVVSFAIELVFGLILQQFGANSWDYSEQFTFNLYGCIALEYAPLWYFGSIAFEQIQIKACTSAIVPASSG